MSKKHGATQLVRLRLPVKLVAALEEMVRYPFGMDEDPDGLFGSAAEMGDPFRTLPDAIHGALRYAVWKWSHGLGPDKELSGRWLDWDECLPDNLALECEARRAASNPETLERLVGLEQNDPGTESADAAA